MELTDYEGKFLKFHLLRRDRDHGVIIREESPRFYEITRNLVEKEVLAVIDPITNFDTKIFQLSASGCEALMRYLGGRLHREYQVVEKIGSIHEPTIFPTWRGLVVGKISTDYNVQLKTARADIMLPLVHNLLFQEVPIVVQPSMQCTNLIRLTLIPNQAISKF